jgi:hypothetical protein
LYITIEVFVFWVVICTFEKKRLYEYTQNCVKIQDYKKHFGADFESVEKVARKFTPKKVRVSLFGFGI